MILQEKPKYGFKHLSFRDYRIVWRLFEIMCPGPTPQMEFLQVKLYMCIFYKKLPRCSSFLSVVTCNCKLIFVFKVTLKTDGKKQLKGSEEEGISAEITTWV